MTNQEIDAMKSKLTQIGLGFESINVFGAIRCNVHIKCVGRDTAGKWAASLSEVFSGAKVRTSATAWPAADNKGTCLRPTMRQGFLIAVAA